MSIDESIAHDTATGWRGLGAPASRLGNAKRKIPNAKGKMGPKLASHPTRNQEGGTGEPRERRTGGRAAGGAPASGPSTYARPTSQNGFARSHLPRTARTWAGCRELPRQAQALTLGLPLRPVGHCVPVRLPHGLSRERHHEYQRWSCSRQRDALWNTLPRVAQAPPPRPCRGDW